MPLQPRYCNVCPGITTPNTLHWLALFLQEGTPLTHERYLRRHRGSYGPAISARSGTFPGAGTPIPGLYQCGDSCMPGIGVPAAAASGMIAANTLAPVWSHLQLLDALSL